MKKVIVVLVIAVLVAGLAFAGTFHGFADISFSVDLDKNQWGFKNTVKGEYTFTFELDTSTIQIGAEHKTDVWAELDAEASAYIDWYKMPLTGPYGDLLTDSVQYTARITKADIHIGEDLTIGILNAGKAADFASSYYKVYLAPNDNKVRSAVAATGKADGFTVKYKDWKGGFGAQGTWGDDEADNTYSIFAHVETPTFKFADDAVTVDAGAYAFLADKNANLDPAKASNFGGGFKVAYTSEKITADAEADLKYLAVKDNEAFLVEAAANAELNFVEKLPITVNVFATPGALFTWDDSNAFYTGDYAKTIKLDAKVAAGYTVDINDDTALDLSAFAEVRDAIVPAMSLAIGATEGTTLNAFTFKLSESVSLMNLANKDVSVETDLEVEAYVEYAHEKFTAYADLISEFVFDKDDNTKAFSNLFFEAGISSDAIVEGATLSLVYGDNAQPFKAAPTKSWVDFLDLENHKGAVTASCKISF